MKSVHTRKLWLCLMMAMWVSTLGSRSESVPALGVDPAALPLTGVFPGGAGWTFYVQVPITVTGFGWYDEGHDGLSGPHEISLWKDLSQLTVWPYIDPYNASLVRSATVPGGTEAPLEGSWRTVSFEAPLTLNPGGYEITGKDEDPIAWLDIFVPALADPRIKLGAPADGGIPPPEGWPGWLLTYGAYLGPMFFVEDPKLRIISDTTGKLTISWEFGTLESAPAAKGPYAPVAGATSPYVVPASSETSRFYRVLTWPRPG